MADIFASLVADGLGMPVWFPRAIRRTVIAALTVTMLLFPDTFTRGVAIYMSAQVNRITHMFRFDREPAPAHRSRPTEGGAADYRRQANASPR